MRGLMTYHKRLKPALVEQAAGNKVCPTSFIGPVARCAVTRSRDAIFSRIWVRNVSVNAEYEYGLAIASELAPRRGLTIFLDDPLRNVPNPVKNARPALCARRSYWRDCPCRALAQSQPRVCFLPDMVRRFADLMLAADSSPARRRVGSHNGSTHRFYPRLGGSRVIE